MNGFRWRKFLWHALREVCLRALGVHFNAGFHFLKNVKSLRPLEEPAKKAAAAAAAKAVKKPVREILEVNGIPWRRFLWHAQREVRMRAIGVHFAAVGHFLKDVKSLRPLEDPAKKAAAAAKALKKQQQTGNGAACSK